MSLLQALADEPVRLDPFGDVHVEGLRAACSRDAAIWDIYPVSLLPEHFDATLASLRALGDQRLMFAVQHQGDVVGMTSYIKPQPDEGVVEIGGTYIAPEVRGGPFNRTMKALMIEHAFALDYRHVRFRIDTRNRRSMRAVEKLGARPVTVLMRDMVTWTGFVRDTAVYELSPADWRRERA